MKTFTLLLAFAILSLAAVAQKNFPQKTQFSIGADIGLPTSGIKDSHSFMLGVSAQGAISLAKPLQLTANIGFLNFFGKTVNYNLQDAPSYATSADLQVLPIKAGLRYFLEPNFYIQGDAGVAIILNRADLNYTHSSAFTYSPQMGVLLAAGANNFIDLGLRYQATGKYDTADPASKYSFLGLRVAYGF